MGARVEIDENPTASASRSQTCPDQSDSQFCLGMAPHRTALDSGDCPRTGCRFYRFRAAVVSDDGRVAALRANEQGGVCNGRNCRPLTGVVSLDNVRSSPHVP